MTGAKQPVMIMAGGTGGHVYPGLAVALELLKRGAPVIWLGTRAGLEARVVPQHDIPVEWLSVSGVRGKRGLALLRAPFLLFFALWQALRIFLRCKPRAVLGLGGFVAGPGGLMAALLRKPLVIHEQNAVAGLTNRWLLPLSRFALEGFPGTFTSRKAVITGNPVRAEIAAVAPPDKRFAEQRTRLHLLVFGGSLGAAVFNDVVPRALHTLSEDVRPEVWQQVGEAHLDAAQQNYRSAGVVSRLDRFIEDMAEAYCWADLVLCRAGALTVAELAAVGVAAILVPYPYAVADEQTANAQFLTRAGAGVLIPQADFTPARVAQVLKRFHDNRKELEDMAVAARELAKPGVAAQIADICLQAAAGKRPADLIEGTQA
ncbi:MAG: undecaprenyldiphospho-muramoylpentapeptide beta-N-acetylglucosaminyltransferase [Gammaproteobacteria bacterium]